MASKKVDTDKFFKNNKFFLFVKLFLGLITITFFALILPQYFQQDEWHSFGIIQSYGFEYITLNKPIWELLFSDRVGARTIVFVLFKLFGISSFFYALFAALVHIFNSYLVYFLAKKLTKNKLISVVASLFFFFNSLGHQAYSWLGTMSGSATSVTFILLSIILYLSYMKKKTVQNMVKAVFFIWFSFLFKESGFFVFPLIVVIWFLIEKDKSIKFFLDKNWPILFYGFFVTVLFAKSIIFIQGTRANYVDANQSGTLKLLAHLVSYPIEGVGQAFIPFQIVFTLGRYFTQIFIPSLQIDTPNFDIFYTTTGTEILSIILFLLVVFLFVWGYKKYLRADKNLSKFSIFSFAYLFLSFLPYIVLSKGDAYLDSRYYYAGLVGSSFLFSIAVFTVLKKVRLYKVRIIFIALLLLAFLSHIYFLFSDLFYQANVAYERKNIISQIEKEVPNLNKKTVFYINGNSPGYYGIPELKVPFQSGLGQVLLVIYSEKQRVSQEIFKESTLNKTLDIGFLYDTVAQGYKEINGQGFGYYYDKKLLNSEIKSNKFNKKNVIFLFYDIYSKQIIKE